MPLLDHFHPPVSTRKGWKGCHALWAGFMVQRLNEVILPKRYESEPEIHAGAKIEIDVATFDKETHGFATNGRNGGPAVAVLPRAYTPPAPTIVGAVQFADPDLYEVKIFKEADGWQLVAAIELVSEASKDRPESRRSFARKCASLLQHGVSVVVIDVVTNRRANMHAELVDVLDLAPEFGWDSPTDLSVVSYRTAQGASEPQYATPDGNVRLEVWPHALAIGGELPTVPLWLAGDLVVALELELAYAAMRKSLRLTDEL